MLVTPNVLICLALDLEKLLIDVGALEGNDSRVLRLSPPSEDLSTASRKSIAPTSSAEDDDEWA